MGVECSVVLEIDLRADGMFLRCPDCGNEHGVDPELPYVKQVDHFVNAHPCLRQDVRRVIRLPD